MTVHYMVLLLILMKTKRRTLLMIGQEKIEDETLLELIKHENILVTPHIAFFSDEAVRNLVEGGLNAALSVINTGKCETQLN